ncbi:hypothetical protein KBA41_07990 [Candidatus Ozemobacteraceae bacterium]|nr:hypothetical protein [Candidatus Ozemobacteraceae bacterium]
MMPAAGRFGMAFLSGTLLVLAHLVTAVIQRDPWVVRQWLETGAGELLPDPWWFPALTGISIAAWAAVSWLHSLGALTRSVYGRLSAAWGRPAVWIFLLFSLLPQRVMDDNSGYIFLTADNPVWWLAWEMDWARALLAFDFVLRMIGSEPVVSPPLAPSIRSLAVLSLAGLCVPVLIGQFALGGVPHVQDEIIQEWHARLLDAGRLTSPETSVRSSFLVAGIGDNGKSLFSTYQPAFSYLLFIARRAGAGELLNPALGVVAFWLLYLILRRSHGEETARTALCVGLVSPFALLMQASLMNHVLMLFLIVAGAFSLDTADRGHLRMAAVMGGLALGLAWMTRRVDAVALHLAWLVAWFAFSAPWGRRVLWGLAALALSAGVLLMNMHLASLAAGDSLYIIRHGQRVVHDLARFELGRHLANVTDNLCGMGVFAFGGIIAAFAGIGLLRPLDRGPAGLVARFFLIDAALIVLGYSVYDYQDFCYGPRYHFSLLPLAAIGVALILTRLSNDGLARAARHLLAAGVTASFLFAAAQAWAVLGNEFWHINPEFSRFVDRFRGKPRVLLVASPTRQRLDLARHLQSVWRFSGAEIIEFLSADFIDTAGLRDFLDHRSPPTKELCMKYIDQYQQMNRFRRPELYGINVYEVPRLNTIDPLSQEVVLAIDRGDKANEALLRALPAHEPLLVRRAPEGYAAEPYRRAGVDSFGDLLVP